MWLSPHELAAPIRDVSAAVAKRLTSDHAVVESVRARRHARVTLREAHVALKGGRLEESAALVEQAARMCPSYHLIGVALLRLHRHAARESRSAVALAPARAAHELAADEPRIAQALARVLRDEGRAHHDAGRRAAALVALREARSLELRHRLKRDTKLCAAIARILTLEATDAAREGHADRARLLLDEALDARPDDHKCRDFAEQLAEVSPLAADLGATPPSGDRAGLPDLVLIEDGVDERLLGVVLASLEHAECFALRRLRYFAGAETDHAVQAIFDLGTAGLDEDAKLCHHTDAQAAVVRAVAREHLPEAAVCAAGVDLLDHLAHDIDDAAFRTGRLLQLSARLLAERRHGRCFFVLGDGRLARALGTTAEREFGSANTWGLWCSRATGRRQRTATRIASALAPETASRTYETVGVRILGGVVATSPEDTRTPTYASAGSSGTSVSAPDSSTVAVATTPYLPVVTNLLPVLAELDAPVTFVIPWGAGASPGYEHYARCASEDPRRRRLHHLPAPDEKHTESDAVDQGLAALAADDRLARLTLGEAAVWPLLEPTALKLLTHQLSALASFAERFAEYLVDSCPATVIVGPDRASVCRVACTLARRSGIPSVFPQNVLLGESPRLKALDADVGTVNDRYTRQLLHRAHGTALDRLRITGIPRFDAIARARQERSGRGADGGHVIALVLQRFAPEYAEHWIKLVVGAVADRADVRLLVRPHPGEPAAARVRYAALLARLDHAGRFAIDSGDLYDMLADATLVVGAFSNVILEAAMFGRVALSANLTGGPLPADFARRGIAVGADSEDELREQLLALLDDEDAIARARARQEAFFARNPHLRDGCSARRVAEVIEDLAGSAPAAAAATLHA